jgi:hypothetical protein
MKTHFFWNMSPRHWVIGSRHFEGATFFCSELQTLNITALCSSETWGTDYPVTRRRISKERRVKPTAVKTRRLAVLGFVV